MPSASSKPQLPLVSSAVRAVCKTVPGGAQPCSLLLPVGLELWVYVQKMRRLQKRRMEASCLELALEGERLCKAGDFKAGAAFFEAAVQVGTEDLKTLSAIYSQLGNAYFYLKEYSKALEYHKHDLTLARTIGDRIGEAKASGNLGNTLKILGQFDEAVVCCQRHLDISQEQGDKIGEARALYNIGNVYHAKGKHLSWNMAQDPGYLPQEVKETLQKASEYYERNLSLVKELGDRAAQGRAYGNLGNTQYLLGNFSEAIAFHKERLAIAKEFGDKAAERRAYSNLGNAHIFLGRFDISAEYYKKTLQLSRQLKDQAVEAQACYSLGNTYTLLQDYEKAIEYHLKHLVIAQELGDRVGEGRACWSLGNAYVSLGSHEQALHFARKHLEISQEIGDRTGELTAQVNMAQLRAALGLGPGDEEVGMARPYSGYEAQGARPKRVQRNSMDSLDLLKFPSEKKINRTPSDEECFFDLLSKFQSNRMDDQRCPLEECPSEAAEAAATPVPALEERIRKRGAHSSLMASPQTEEFFDLIASSQSRRLDDQRANVGNLPGLRITHNNLGHLCMEGDAQEPGDEFFNMLMKCQSSRIDDQRCAPPDSIPRGPTMPDEDFFSLIQRVQAKRMDEQRVDLASAQEEAEEEQQRPGSS
ncbi:G-protein-signaling modulator 1 isoform X5 [Gallus gallus]|uniref:G-protein-signaling modulator 1 isoform X5 n=1 Tax=Gallus gallus TaxID=9031 RepID=UPI001AE9F882|nr:G-protein-signaling modulator 1 isoform X5 [Gallus gallus]XP_040542077.1 G-protein-signaling modulator 1 isoform X5 [Gallus gallus]